MHYSIVIKNLNYKINKDEKTLFKINDLKIITGEKILIQGPSGKGKTTFLHIVGGLLKLNSPCVQVLEQDLFDISSNKLGEMYKRNIGFVFQKLNLIDFLTAKENVTITNCDPTYAETILKKLGLQDCLNKQCQKLSLGEKQRVAVARALVKSAQLLLADEPTSSLDDLNAKIVAQLLTADKNKTVLVVSHDSRLVKYFDRVIQFEEYAT